MPRPLLRDSHDVDNVAAFLKALAHPLRLRIVALLSEDAQHVNALAGHLDAAQAIVSQQLRILRMAGLVAVTRQHGQAVYRLVDERLFHLLDCMERRLSTTSREMP